MNASELKRYDRQIRLPELGIKGQQKLKAASVLVIGAGGLGCPVLLYLTSAGVGHIGIVDDDLVDESNLHRQILFNTSDIGKNKAETAANKLKVINSHVNLTAYPLRLRTDNAASIIEKYDLVIDGSDNFLTRYLVNDTCISAGKPLVFGSIFKFEGQISVFNYKGGPDYRAVFPEAPDANEMPNCDESGVISTLPGIIGTYMANEAIKVICEFGETLSGKLFVLNALDNSAVVLNYGLNKQSANLQRPLRGILNQYTKIYKEIDLKTLEQWKAADEPFCLVDVREEYEYEESNIGGLNIPLYELNEQIESLPTDKKIILYCTTGARSKIAANLLKDRFAGLWILIMPAF